MPRILDPLHFVFARLEHVQLPTPSGPLQVHIVRWENDTLLKASADNPIEYGVALARFARDATYAFKAERYNLGTSAAGSNRILASDATNLPEVLAQIQPHPAKWRQFNDYVKLVFPRLPAISVVPVDQSQVQIQIWNEDPTNLPQELAVSLAESGTGVGQVLSILAVVLTAEYPRTIIIDEPQSFLHPGALRTLVRILADHSHHQFVIATHSTTVITASRPAQVLRVIKPKAATVIQILNSNDTDDLRMFLRDVGARLSDVFGAEQILWVDGATEEACFPEIIRNSEHHRSYGTKILGVQHTADFDTATQHVARIYNRLSSGVGLLPPAVGFLFDRETRSEKQIDDLRREGRGRIDFLDRRMFENYLLDPAAIAQVAQSCSGFREPAISEAEIAQWIKEKGTDARFIPDRNIAANTPDWEALRKRCGAAICTFYRPFTDALHLSKDRARLTAY